MMVSELEAFVDQINRVPCYDYTAVGDGRMCHDCAAKVLALFACLLEKHNEGGERSEPDQELEELPF